MASKILSKGTLLQIKLAGTFTTIGNRVSLEGPDTEVKFKETTDLDSTFVEKKPTIVDLGTMKGKLFYDPDDTTHAAVAAKAIAPPATIDDFKLVFPDGMAVPANTEFKGWIKKFTPNGMEREEYLGADFEIELSDLYTFTAGAAS